MLLSGAFAQFVIICMNNRDRGGIKKRAAEEEFQRRQAGRRGGGRMAMERGGEGGANTCRPGCVGLMGVFR